MNWFVQAKIQEMMLKFLKLQWHNCSHSLLSSWLSLCLLLLQASQSAANQSSVGDSFLFNFIDTTEVSFYVCPNIMNALCPKKGA